MKLDLTGSGVIALAAVAGVAGLGFLVYSKRGAIAAGLDKVNPASSGNVVYGGVSAAVQAATGQEDATLGTWLYDLKAKYFPSDADKAAATITKGTPIPPPVNTSIADRWDYYTSGSRGSGSGSGSTVERQYDLNVYP